MTRALRFPTPELPCKNPFCDGYGWVRVSATATTQSCCAPACKRGPHPAKVAASKRTAGGTDDGA